jgi:hypothetical protein
MTMHSPACQQLLREFLATPEDSVQHKIAEYVEGHTPDESLELLLTVIWDDAPATPEFVIAQKLLPSVLAEATAR